jgi:hypothetical protein
MIIDKCNGKKNDTIIEEGIKINNAVLNFLTLYAAQIHTNGKIENTICKPTLTLLLVTNNLLRFSIYLRNPSYKVYGHYIIV